MVWVQEKSDVEAAAPTPALAEARETVVALTRQAGKVQQECGLDILPDEFVRSVLKWGLMEVWTPPSWLDVVASVPFLGATVPFLAQLRCSYSC